MQGTSIVILNYNTLEHTKNCIASIRQHTPAGSYELIVIDNGSTDGSVQWLKAQRGLRCIFNKTNLGFPKGCNQGLQIAKGTELLLLNSDTVVTPRWLQQLRGALYSAPDTGAVGCVTNHSSERQQIAISYTDYAGMSAFAEKYNQADAEKWEPVLKLVGFCLLIRREVYQKLGGLDERFSPGNYEDDDYCLRIWQAGYRVLLCRDTFIHHIGNASFLQTLSQGDRDKKIADYNALLRRNAGLFEEKWQIPQSYNEPHLKLMNTMLAENTPGQRALLLDCGCGQDLLCLQPYFPKAELTGITADERQAAIGSRASHVLFCPALEKNVFSILQPPYDCILVTDVLKTMKNGEAFIYRLLDNLTSDGKLYFELEGTVYTLDRTARDER